MDPRPVPRARQLEQFAAADATTRSGHGASLHALHAVEHALSAPAPRRERTWLHRVGAAVDALIVAIDRQIDDNDHSISLLAEIALTEPEHIDDVINLTQEQRSLRVALASLREQLDEHPELPIDTSCLRDRFAALAHRYREHYTREVALIHKTFNVDITEPPDRADRPHHPS